MTKKYIYELPFGPRRSQFPRPDGILAFGCISASSLSALSAQLGSAPTFSRSVAFSIVAASSDSLSLKLLTTSEIKGTIPFATHMYERHTTLCPSPARSDVTRLRGAGSRNRYPICWTKSIVEYLFRLPVDLIPKLQSVRLV